MPIIIWFNHFIVKYYALIVAGGKGTRMGSELPKQFASLCGEPILFHTIRAFYQSSVKPHIILVLSQEYFAYWENLCKENDFQIPHQIVAGGNTRFESVQNGLKLVSEPSIVAIHDAVRPIITNDIITNSFLTAQKNKSAIAVIPSKDSIRKVTNGKSFAMDRGEIYLVQTPQTFQSALLKNAYTQENKEAFTDDASVFESDGNEICLIQGSSQNIKITYPEDLLIAELFLKKNPA